MKNSGRKSIKILLSMVAFFAIFMTWYNYKYSMDQIEGYTINETQLEQKVLIASQGSDFKNKVAQGIISELKSAEAFIKLIDISELGNIKETEWSAIVLIHTWEMQQPPVAIKNFVDRIGDKDQLVVLTTSGDGGYHMEEIDAITAASRTVEIEDKVEEVVKQVRKILAKKN